jgi:integration host factor subunit beta
MATITKKDMIERITERTKESRLVVRAVVQEFLEQVILELKKGNRIEFRDFGVFEARRRAPRTAQNPKTLKRVEVPSRIAVKFKVGRLMRETLERAGKASVTPAQAAADLKDAIEDRKPEPKA